MTIEKMRENNKLFLNLEGRLDTVTAPGLMAVIEQELTGVEELELDFQKLDYLSSAGLRVILDAQQRMNRQGSMVIRHVNGVIREVFEVTGFLNILTIK